jgi:hypothetical protein
MTPTSIQLGVILISWDNWYLISQDKLVLDFDWLSWLLVLGCLHSRDLIWIYLLSRILGNKCLMSIFWDKTSQESCYLFLGPILTRRPIILLMGLSKWNYSQQLLKSSLILWWLLLDFEMTKFSLFGVIVKKLTNNLPIYIYVCMYICMYVYI